MARDEIYVDLFAGGGGASVGFYMATGKHVDIAVNHDMQAIAMHAENHPDTQHFVEDVFDVNPVEVCGGRPVGMLWLSPDCKHFSKAKGGKPVSCNIRSLAWVGIKWVKAVKPRVIILENVEEFRTWGPLDDNGQPDKNKMGETFKEYIRQYEDAGYMVEYRELVASDYGAPTIRKRLFMIARCDGRRIVWPKPTHGDPKKFPDRKIWRTAADCIDWEVPAYSIFLTKEEGKKYGVKRPLVENTLIRIGKGIKKFIIDNDNPYVVDSKASFVSTYYGGKPGATARGSKTDAPVGTITAGGSRHGVVTAFLAQHNLGNIGRGAEQPMSTITATGSQQQLVEAKVEPTDGTGKVCEFVMKMRNGNVGFRADSPMHTITAGGGHFAEVQAYIMKYYGQGEGSDMSNPTHTVTTKERFAIIEVLGEEYVITDIAMRMFTPRELFRAQGFPEWYKIDIMYNGKVLAKTAQVRMCGNSVSPNVAEAIIRSNIM